MPLGAVTGPISLTTAAGGALAAVEARADPAAAPAGAEPRALARAGPAREPARRSSRPAPAAPRPSSTRGPGVKFSFRLSGASATSLKVELVSAADGTVVKTWTPQDVRAGPGAEHLLERPARAAPRARPGRYSFRLTAASADGSEARSSQTGDVQRDAFDLYDHIFPIRGRARLRRRRRALRRRARRPHPPGPGHVRQVRHAAGGGARRAREVQAVPRARPATTS